MSRIVSVFVVFAIAGTAFSQWPIPISPPHSVPFVEGYDPYLPYAPIYSVFPDGGFGVPTPQSVLIDSQVIANAQLPPATILLSHRRNEKLQVEVIDRKAKETVFQGDIAPGQAVEVTLPRDSGGVVQETYRSFDFYGNSVQQTQTRTLPIDIRYEVIVRAWQIQSIAIDRTGKSPSPIEDINVQGKGVGRFTLPPGAQLGDGEIDVYRNAVAAGNPGAIPPQQPPAYDDGPASDPLRRALEEVLR